MIEFLLILGAWAVLMLILYRVAGPAKAGNKATPAKEAPTTADEEQLLGVFSLGRDGLEATRRRQRRGGA